MRIQKKPKVHISIVGGAWYAMPGNNSDETRSALVPAISYCDRLNHDQKRGKSQAARRAARQWANRQEAAART